MRYYCTHFDINYIGHALSLYESLSIYGESFKLFMFCMDDTSLNHLQTMNLSNATLISSLNLEAKIKGLAQAKANRSRVEYFYTCSPATCYYILQEFSEVNLITYLDADLYFFASPEPVFEEISNADIGVIEHRFHWITRRNIVYGRFNVGWISFRRSDEGLACLEEWMGDCINWCYQRLEGDKYADQKYLDKWPGKYSRLKIIRHKGANLAIWNVGGYKLTQSQNNVYVNGEKLIFYHFANLKQLDAQTFTTDLSRVFVRTAGIIQRRIYLPYIHLLLKYQVKKIEAKKDLHIKKGFRIKRMSRELRRFLYPDLISVK